MVEGEIKHEDEDSLGFAVNEFGETVNWESDEGSTSGRDAPPASSSAVPTTIGRYEIRSILGRGGFGAVYLGYDAQLDRNVAVKVPRLRADAEVQKLFLAEARQLAQLKHNSIVTVHDVGIEDGLCYIVSEYLEGENLNRWLANRTLSWQESVEIVLPLADALAAAHSRSTVHRDVKPANIIMTARDDKTVPVLVDFGLAISESSPANVGTQRGKISGTPNYMSPEQAQGEGHRIDGRTDIYSLSVVLYRLLSGQLPFAAASVKDLLAAVICDEPRPPRQFVHNIPRDLERVCLRALSKRISERYTTAGDFAEELRGVLKQNRREAELLRSVPHSHDKSGIRDSIKVLIAEDHELSRFKLESDLRKWGHQVVAAEDGAEAWELFRKEEFSIVITDWMMPNVDGLELVKKIRDANLANYVYIIMLTAKSERHDIITGMGAGADDFLSKPFHRDELQVRLRAGIRITKMNRQLNETNQRLMRSKEAAAQIQRSYLPTKNPSIDGFDVAWNYRPCADLGSDMFNIVQLDDKHVGLYVLDVSGDGVPSSLLATALSRVMSASTDAQSLLVQPGAESDECRILEPHVVIERLNRKFSDKLKGKQFFTVTYGILNRESREFRVSSAGHPPVIFQRDGQTPTMLDIDSFPLGMAPQESEFPEVAVRLESGDRLLLYSDGLTDTMNKDGDIFGVVRLLDVINRAHHVTTDELLHRITSEIDSWRGDAEQNDDASILALATF